ncbi:DNA polymerase Y family protein [Streptomyces sp. 8N706]|uniref:DNA polymerase Y family protein n=1 Tax=Streptomyces sp. 8N706 TaxID=3457416 RepID=UPI003FD03088
MLYVRFRTAGAEAAPGEEAYAELLGLLAEFSPVIEALPPDAALVDVRGALRYFGRDAAGIAALVRVRALARYGADCTIGIAANPLLARMAAHDPAPGDDAIRTVPDDPDAVAAFLATKPVTALHGVGQATARTLSSYGLDSVGRIAATPPATLQRILGASAGRRVHEQAHGIDPTPVSSAPVSSASRKGTTRASASAPARSVSAEHRFDHDELDADRRRRALLALTDDLGFRLRTDGQVARALTLIVRYADRSTTTRTRVLPEPTAHTPALAATAYALHDALALQRARVRAVSLRAEDLTGAEHAGHQLTFDQQAANARRLEPVIDRANARWPGAVRPAALADPPRRTA